MANCKRFAIIETSASTPTKENVIASAARMSISSKVSEPQI
jgi:hypothetical protein